MKTETKTVSEQKWLEAFSSGIAALDAGNLKKAIKELEVAIDLAEEGPSSSRAKAAPSYRPRMTN